jgi:hypothetical protein
LLGCSLTFEHALIEAGWASETPASRGRDRVVRRVGAGIPTISPTEKKCGIKLP